MKNVRQVSALFIFSLPVFYLFWVVFVGTFSLHELLIGVIGSVLASAGILTIELHYPANFSPKPSDLLTLWRMPWYLISGTWEIAAVAAKDLMGIERAKSLFRVVEFDAGKTDDPHATARRVLATAYTTIAPNFIVLGVNTSSRKLLFHQIKRSSVPKTTQELGARG